MSDKLLAHVWTIPDNYPGLIGYQDERMNRPVHPVAEENQDDSDFIAFPNVFAVCC